MQLNLRAKCTNNNGASATYTWRNVECESEEHGHALAREWGGATEKEFKSPDVDFPYQTKSIETSLPTTAVLEEEDHQHFMDKWDADHMFDDPEDY